MIYPILMKLQLPEVMVVMQLQLLLVMVMMQLLQKNLKIQNVCKFKIPLCSIFILQIRSRRGEF